jgi:hypothetical protein
MSKNPILNAFAALAYIVLVALMMTYGSKLMPHTNAVLVPIAVISLFTLSAAIMGYIFCYQPLQLYFDGKKKEAVKLFLQTVAVFGCLTVLMLILMFAGVNFNL